MMFVEMLCSLVIYAYFLRRANGQADPFTCQKSDTKERMSAFP